jgi:predicted metalloprotease
VAEPVVVGSDEVTLANEEPTTTGPTVGGWPLDQFEAPPLGELVWQPDSASVAPPPGAGRRPAYYVLLGAAVVLVVGLVAFAALVTVRKPTQAVAGTGSAAIPVVTSSSQAPTSSGTSSAAPPVNPYAELARHPLSTETTRKPDVTCVLPRFDLPDDRQAAFFQAAKVCADDAWRPVLAAAGLDDVQVRLVTVTGAVQTQSCGELAPTSPPTSCDGTVYMTPAYLRDTEQLGRYPGKYFGVFLREYARAVQFGAGLEQLASAVPDGSADIDTRLDQQATCLAGMTSGAMAGRGDVDDNITGEIRQRLSSVDAPPDAESLLDKGFQQRAPAACNTWAK